MALVVALTSGCLSTYAYPENAFDDQDSGAGSEVDLGGEDLTSGTVEPGHYHPVGYAAAAVHGRDLKWQVQDCRTCHAQDLTGGVIGAGGATLAPPSCDSCHKANWRTTCTYCHGTTGGTGAPPRDIDGQADPAKISFPGHAAHLSGRITQAFDCGQCHRKPTDALSPYHIFDASPRRGENSLAGGLSPLGIYDPMTKVCSNLYCHGNGRSSTGAMSVATKGPLACSACHADITASAKWSQMSGDHGRHLRLGVDCTFCHAATVAASPSTISDVTKHLNGKPDVLFSAAAGTIAYAAANKRCTGTCHGKDHSETW